jgi:hypothetical protein
MGTRSGWIIKVLGQRRGVEDIIVLSLEKPVSSLVSERRVRVEVPKSSIGSSLPKAIALAIINSCKQVSPRGVHHIPGTTVMGQTNESVTIRLEQKQLNVR